MTQPVRLQLKKLLSENEIKSDVKLPSVELFSCNNIKTMRDIEAEKGEKSIKELKKKLNKIMDSIK